MKNEERILSILEGMQKEMTGMRGDITEMRGDNIEMRGDIAGLKKEMAGVQEGMKKMNTRMTDMHNSICKIEIEHGEKLGLLSDSLPMTKIVLQKVDKLQDTVDKLKFGDDVIKLVNIIESKSKEK